MAIANASVVFCSQNRRRYIGFLAGLCFLFITFLFDTDLELRSAKRFREILRPYHSKSNLTNAAFNWKTDQRLAAALSGKTLTASSRQQINGSVNKGGFTVGINVTLPSWNERNQLNGSPIPRYRAFGQTMTDTEYQHYMEIFKVFKETCEKFGVQYMLYGGTLIGAYRHHGIIPWDDDLDVLVNGCHRNLLYNGLSNIPGFTLTFSKDQPWKFHNKIPILMLNENHGGHSLGWPYIDIFFFDENETHIWDTFTTQRYPETLGLFCYLKSLVFPLVVSAFEGFNDLPVPKCTRKVLEQSYDITMCVTSAYSHKLERRAIKESTTLPCKRLYPYLLFVFRHHDNIILKHGNKIVYEIISSRTEPC